MCFVQHADYKQKPRDILHILIGALIKLHCKKGFDRSKTCHSTQYMCTRRFKISVCLGAIEAVIGPLNLLILSRFVYVDWVNPFRYE